MLHTPNKSRGISGAHLPISNPLLTRHIEIDLSTLTKKIDNKAQYVKLTYIDNESSDYVSHASFVRQFLAKPILVIGGGP